MKATLETFDFSQLTTKSVLVFEILAENSNDFEAAQNTIIALRQSGKIPMGILVLVASQSHPVKIREIPEEVMNQNGWYRMKPLPITEVVLQNTPLPPL